MGLLGDLHFNLPYCTCPNLTFFICIAAIILFFCILSPSPPPLGPDNYLPDSLSPPQFPIPNPNPILIPLPILIFILIRRPLVLLVLLHLLSSSAGLVTSVLFKSPSRRQDRPHRPAPRPDQKAHRRLHYLPGLGPKPPGGKVRNI